MGQFRQLIVQPKQRYWTRPTQAELDILLVLIYCNKIWMGFVVNKLKTLMFNIQLTWQLSSYFAIYDTKICSHYLDYRLPSWSSQRLWHCSIRKTYLYLHSTRNKEEEIGKKLNTSTIPTPKTFKTSLKFGQNINLCHVWNVSWNVCSISISGTGNWISYHILFILLDF